MENACPGNGREDGTRLFRLGDRRVTKVRFVSDPTKELILEERWMRSTTSHDLPEKWTGETIFDYLTDEEVQKPETTEAMAPRLHDDVHQTMQQQGDRWLRVESGQTACLTLQVVNWSSSCLVA